MSVHSTILRWLVVIIHISHLGRLLSQGAGDNTNSTFGHFSKDRLLLIHFWNHDVKNELFF